MEIDRWGRDDDDDATVWGQRGSEGTKEPDLLVECGDVVKGEGRKHQVIGPGSQGGWRLGRNQAVHAPRVTLASLGEHGLSDVDAHRVEPEVSQEAGGAPGATPEVQGLISTDVVVEDGGKVAKGEVVGTWVLQAGVGFSPGSVLVDIGELVGHSSPQSAGRRCRSAMTTSVGA